MTYLSPIPAHPSSSNSTQWFVIESKIGQTELANHHLASAGIEVWMPIDIKRAANRARSSQPRKDIKSPRFGRYFFIHCKMTDALQAAILATKGIFDILREVGTNRPAPVPNDQIESLKMAAVQPNHKKDSMGLTQGKWIEITIDPFKGKKYLIKSLDKRGAVRLEVDILGRPVPLTIEAGHVTLLQQAKPR